MGTLKFGNNPLTIRWYLLNVLNSTSVTGRKTTWNAWNDKCTAKFK